MPGRGKRPKAPQPGDEFRLNQKQTLLAGKLAATTAIAEEIVNRKLSGRGEAVSMGEIIEITDRLAELRHNFWEAVYAVHPQLEDVLCSLDGRKVVVEKKCDHDHNPLKELAEMFEKLHR